MARMSTRFATPIAAQGKRTRDFSDIAAMLHQREELWLDRRAARSHLSRGRVRPEPEGEISAQLRTQWQRDRDRILHCKAFRRLKHKTQVFVSPEQDHYRTRLTHTLEVSQVARTVSRALRLNEDLTEAIGLGHDLGHAPFGHVGEEALDAAYRRFDPNARFRHYEQSLRLVDLLEKNGDGLNLTWETRDGILHHSKGKSNLMVGENAARENAAREGAQTSKRNGDLPATLEGQVVRICDRVAYVNHDIDDAIRAGLIRAADLPADCARVLGGTHTARITTMIAAIIAASSEIIHEEIADRENAASGIEYSNSHSSHVASRVARRVTRAQISMQDDVMHATDTLKDWMFEHVYKLDSVDETPRVERVLEALFERFMHEPQLMKHGRASHEISRDETQAERARIVCDYIAGMTDRFASQTYLQLFMPSSWRGA